MTDEEDEFEANVSKLLAILAQERDELPEMAIELMDWLEEYFECRS